MNSTIFAAFKIDNIEMAISIQQVKEVINYPEKINKMPLSPLFLIGVFNLRGQVIPLINLNQLLNLPKNEEQEIPTTNKKVIVADLENALIGFVIDETTEILRIQKECLNLLSYNNTKSDKIIAGIIELQQGERMIQVMNAHALLQIQNIPQITAKQTLLKTSKNQMHQYEKCISFQIGKLALAIEISKIFEIIKVPEIQPSPVEDDLCTGVINLRGISIPIIKTNLLLGENEINDNHINQKERRILILKNQESLIGLLIDFVISISFYGKEDIIEVPKIIQNRESNDYKNRIDMIKGCIILKETAETFLLETESVIEHPNLRKISENHQQFYKNHRYIQEKKKFNREVYISFYLDQLYALPIADIQEIITYTDNLISPPEKNQIIEGMINLRGKLITVINTNALYQITSSKLQDRKNKKIIILKNNTDHCGLIVDNIDSIVTINSENKFKLPSLMTQNLKEKFSEDIKEVISIEDQENQKKALVILSIEPIINRIKFNMAA